MIECLVLIEGKNVESETLRNVSLANALQLVIGSIPDGSVILHVSATLSADLNNALIEFTKLPGVTNAMILRLKNDIK